MIHSDKHSRIIEIGDDVEVDKTEDNEDFRGNVVAFKNDFVVVEDLEGDCFDMRGIELEVRD